MHFRLVGPRTMTRVLLVHLDCAVQCVIIFSFSWLLRPCLVQPRCFSSLKICTHDLLLWHMRLIAPTLVGCFWHCISGTAPTYLELVQPVLFPFDCSLVQCWFSSPWSSSASIFPHRSKCLVTSSVSSVFFWRRCKGANLFISMLHC